MLLCCLPLPKDVVCAYFSCSCVFICTCAVGVVFFCCVHLCCPQQRVLLAGHDGARGAWIITRATSLTTKTLPFILYQFIIYYLFLDNYSGHITHNLDPAIYSLLIYYLLFFSWIITRATPLTTKTLPFILDYFFIFYLFLDNYSGQITHNQDPALYSL